MILKTVDGDAIFFLIISNPLLHPETLPHFQIIKYVSKHKMKLKEDWKKITKNVFIKKIIIITQTREKKI